jgi:hypothetical protein
MQREGAKGVILLAGERGTTQLAESQKPARADHTQKKKPSRPRSHPKASSIVYAPKGIYTEVIEGKKGKIKGWTHAWRESSRSGPHLRHRVSHEVLCALQACQPNNGRQPGICLRGAGLRDMPARL